MTDGCFSSNQNRIRYARKISRRLSVERKRGIRMVKYVIKVSIVVIIGNFKMASQADSRIAQVVVPCMYNLPGASQPYNLYIPMYGFSRRSAVLYEARAGVKGAKKCQSHK
jgi:hypothetical protein